jgi:pimeloyl-ACP methyl ester carboxylesterase
MKEIDMNTQKYDRTVTMPDGRTVGFADFGGTGTPVLWCHGGPGSRLEPEYFVELAANLGLRLIGIDRPGYGLSTPQPGRTIGAWTGDALAVADALGLGEFTTVGASTGGAYALALAARTARVIGVVACCALTDMRWPEGRAAMAGPGQVWAAPSREAACAVVATQFASSDGGLSADPGSHLIPLAPSDAELFAEPRWARLWRDNEREMFAHGVVGYTDDRLADGNGWHTFDVRRIACPVLVLHGTSDTMVPVAQAPHTQRLVPGAVLDVRDGLGHFSIAPELLPALHALLANTGRAKKRA